MSFRWRCLLPALLVLVPACTGPDAPRGDPAPRTTAATTTRDTATGTPGPSTGPTGTTPPVPRTSAPAAPTSWSLVYQRGRAVYAIRIDKGAPARPRKLTDVGGPAVADRSGRYLAVTERRRVVLVELGTGRTVATVQGGDAAVFADDGSLLVSVRATAPSNEHDCHRPTELVRVDPADGSRRRVGTVDDQFTPFAVAGSVMVGHVPTPDCDVPIAVLADMRTGQRRVLGEHGSQVRSVSPDGSRIWVHRYPEDGHPRGREVVVDPQGRELARLPFYAQAAFGPGSLVAYTDVTYGPKGTPEYHFTQDTKLKVADGIPAKGDRGVSLAEASALVWSADGSLLAGRTATSGNESISWRAFVCTARPACRGLDLTWYDDVDLLLVVPTATLS